MEIVTTLVEMLAPILPFLKKETEAAASEACNKFGSAAWEKAKELWEKLSPKVEAEPYANLGANGLAEKPADKKAIAVFKLGLENILNADPSLAEELKALIEELNELLSQGSSGSQGTGNRFTATKGGVAGIITSYGSGVRFGGYGETESSKS